MVKKNYKWICVNKDFHRQLKKEAADRGKSIIDFTEELTKRGEKEKGKKINDFWRLI